MRQSQREVKQVINPLGQSKILHIEIPAQDGSNTVDKITDREEMEQHMMYNFKAKFLEVYHTPIPHRLFTDILGPLGLHNNVDAILRGEYQLPSVIHLDIVEFIHHFRIDDLI